MPTDFDKMIQSIRDAEKQYQADMKRVAETASLPDFDQMNATIAQQFNEATEFSRKQAQAPLDTVATLEQIVRMLESDRAEQETLAQKAAEDSKKQKRTETIRFIITTIIGVIAAAAAILSVVVPILF